MIRDDRCVFVSLLFGEVNEVGVLLSNECCCSFVES